MICPAQILTRFLYKLAQNHGKGTQEEGSMTSLKVAANMFEFHWLLLLLPGQRWSANLWRTS